MFQPPWASNSRIRSSRRAVAASRCTDSSAISSPRRSSARRSMASPPSMGRLYTVVSRPPGRRAGVRSHAARHFRDADTERRSLGLSGSAAAARTRRRRRAMIAYAECCQEWTFRYTLTALRCRALSSRPEPGSALPGMPNHRSMMGAMSPERYRRASVRFVRVLVEAPSIPRRLSSCTEYWLGRSVESTLAVSERYIDCVSTCVTSMGVAQGAGRQDEGRQAPASASLHAGPHVDQQLVVGVETDEAHAGELEIDDHVECKAPW